LKKKKEEKNKMMYNRKINNIIKRTDIKLEEKLHMIEELFNQKLFLINKINNFVSIFVFSISIIILSFICFFGNAIYY